MSLLRVRVFLSLVLLMLGLVGASTYATAKYGEQCYQYTINFCYSFVDAEPQTTFLLFPGEEINLQLPSGQVTEDGLIVEFAPSDYIAFYVNNAFLANLNSYLPGTLTDTEVTDGNEGYVTITGSFNATEAAKDSYPISIAVGNEGENSDFLAINLIVYEQVTLQEQDPITLANVATSFSVLGEGLGKGDLSYALSNTGGGTLPTGLSFDPLTRTLSSSQSAIPGNYSLNYTVTDAKPSTASVMVNVTVFANYPPSFDGSSIASSSEYLKQGESITSQILPAATQGVGEVTYSLRLSNGSDLPTGLVFTSSTRTLSGTAEQFGNHSLFYQAQDEGGETANLSFSLAFTQDFLVGLPSIDLPDWVENFPFSFTLDGVTPENPGNGALTYNLTSSDGQVLPEGTFFGADNLTFYGQTGKASYSLNLTVSDEDGDINSTIFALQVLKDVPVDFNDGGGTIYSLYGDPVSFSHNAVSSSSYGSINHPVTYSLTARLGSAQGPVLDDIFNFVDFDPQTRTLNGSIPAGAYAEDVIVFILLATDLDGDTDKAFIFANFWEDTTPEFSEVASNLSVIQNSPLSTILPLPTIYEYYDANRVFGVGVKLHNTGRYPTMALTLSNGSALPDSFLLFYDSTDQLYKLMGTPSDIGVYDLLYTATDGQGDQANLTFIVTVLEDFMPGSFVNEVSDVSVLQGQNLTALSLPQIDEGNLPINYSLFLSNGSALPTSLVFNASTLAFSSISPPLANYTFNYSVTDTDGDTYSETFTLSVVEDQIPTLNSTIDDIFILTDDELTPVTLPAVSVGTDANTPFVFTLTQTNSTDLPDGVMFNSSTRSLSGTPTTAGVYSLLYSVFDAQNDTATATFAMNVELSYTPSAFLGDLPAIEVKQALVLNDTQLPLVDEGNGPLNYTLIQSNGSGLPAGLSFDDQSNLLSGTPTQFGNFTLNYSVVDSDNESYSELFNLTIIENTIVSFALNTSIDDILLIENSVLNAITLPQAISGDAPVSYSLIQSNSSDLPIGIVFNSTSRVLNGTGTELGNFSLVYTAQDTDNDRDVLSFGLVIEQDFAVTLASLSDLSGQQDLALNTTILPEGGDGNGVLIYRLLQSNGSNLPDGLSFNASSREFGGTATVYGDFNLTYEVEDIDGDVASSNFILSLSENFPVGIVVADFYVTDTNISLEPGKQVNDMEFYLIDPSKPGNAPFTYTLDGANGLGLSINSSTGLLSGQLPTSFERTFFRIRVTDVDEDTQISGYRHFIPGARKPTFATQSGNLSCPITESSCSYTLPEQSDEGNVHDTISLELAGGVALPSSLSFSEDTNNLVFDTNGVAENTTYSLVYSIEDVDGSNTTQSFELVLSEYFLPVVESVEDISIIQGQDLNLTLPVADSGFGTLSYALSLSDGSELPSGLSYVDSTKTLTVNSTDLNGGDSFTLSYVISDSYDGNATVNFTISVVEDFDVSLDVGTFYENAAKEIALEPGKFISDIEIFTINASNPGNLPLTYSLVGASDIGLSINVTSGLLSGEIVAVFSQTSFRIRVTDADGDSFITSPRFFIAESRTPSFTESDATVSCPANGLICNLTLNAVATQGNIYDAYELVLANGSSLPTELSFDASSLELSLDTQGLPVGSSYQLLYTSTDGDGDMANQSVNLSVSSYVLPVASSVNNLSLIQSQTKDFILPVASGFGVLSYDVTLPNGSALPSHISFTNSSRTLTVNSTNLIGGEDITLSYFVADSYDGNSTVNFTLAVLVDLPVSQALGEFYVNAANEIALEPGKAIDDIEIFIINPDKPGNLPLTYSLIGAADVGLSINTSTGRLSGQVASGLTETGFQIRVTDANGDDHTANERFFIPEARTPTFDAEQGNISCPFGESICTYTLPAQLSEGNVIDTISLQLEGGFDLPDSLVFDEANSSLVFNTSDVFEDTTFSLVYSIEDADGSTTSYSFTLALSSYQAPVIASVDNYSLIQGQILDFTLPAATSSFGVLSYEVSSANGSELTSVSFVNSSRTLTINSSGLSGGDELILNYQVSDIYGGNSSMSLTVSVIEDLPISQKLGTFYENADNEVVLETGKTLTDVQFFAIDPAKPGNLPLTYSLEGAANLLGLSIDSSTGFVSGQVISGFAPTSFWIKVTDADGDSHTSNERSFVSGARTPSFSFENGDLSCPFGDAICSYTLPEQSTEGNVIDTISLQLEGGVALPSSLIFSEANSSLVFNTSGVFEDTTFSLVYSVTDADGSMSSQSFDLELSEYFTPVIDAVNDLSIIQSQVLNFSLPAADSGFGDLSYALSLADGNDLPSGWSFNSSSRVLNVDSSSEVAGAVYNLSYLVSDEYLGNTNVYFTVSVLEDFPITQELSEFYISGSEISLEPGKQASDIEIYRPRDDKPGNAPLTYTLDGASGLGLSINSSTGWLSGLVAGSFPKTSFRIRVTDANGDTHISGFRHFVEGAHTPSFDANTTDLECLQGGSCSYALPGILTEGNVHDTIELIQWDDSALSSALSFTEANTSLLVDSTALPVGTTFSLKYKIYDVDGGGENQTFNITVLQDSLPSLAQLSNVSLIAGEQLSVSLGNSSTGNGVLSYTLAQTNGIALPSGLVFNSSSFSLEIDGSLLDGGDVFDLSYTVTDTDNDQSVVNFSVTVITDLTPALVASNFFATNGNISLAAGSVIDSLSLYSLDAANPGNAPGSFSINGGGSLLGLSLNTSTGILSGSVDSSFTATDFTLVYTDVDGDIASSKALRFIPQALSPVFNDTTSDVSCFFGNVVCSFTLNNASEGNVINEFSAQLANGSELPSSLSFDASNLKLSFDPVGLAVGSELGIRYRVEDIDGSSAQQLFDVIVIANSNPAFGIVEDIEIIQGGFSNTTLPASSGGTNPITYTLTLVNGSQLPSGIVFNPSSQELTVDGSLLSQGDNFTLNYTASDVHNGIGFALFQVVVLEDLLPGISAKDFLVNGNIIALEPGKAINNVSLFAIDSVGDGPAVFSINGGLSILGLTMDADTGALSGTVDGEFESTAFTVSLTDNDGDVSNLSGYSFISEARTPSFNSTMQDIECIVGTTSCNYVLPSVGTAGNLYDTVSLTLDDGVALGSNLNFTAFDNSLVFDPSNLPAGTSIGLRYRVEDADGSMSDQLFSLNVVANQLPTLAGISNKAVIDGEVETFSLSQGTGGNGVLSHSLSLSGGVILPAGLSFNATGFSLQVDTNALVAGITYNLVYEVSDSDGDSDSTSFNVSILSDLLPSLTVSSFAMVNGEIALAPGSTVSNLSLVSVNDLGNAPAIFSINGGSSLLGLSIDTSTGVLSGQLPVSFEDTSFTISLTDSDGDAANASYVFVANDRSPVFSSDSSELACGFGSGVCDYNLSDASLGNFINTFSLSLANGSDLPGSLSFDTQSLELSFDPSGLAVGSAIELTYRVEDIDGSFDEQSFNISISKEIGFASGDLAYILIDQTEVNRTLPEAEFGVGSISYSIDGTLPAGLTFDSSSRQLTGTVSGQGNSSVIYLATDSTNKVASLSVNVSVQVQQMPNANVESTVSSYGQDAAIEIPIIAGDGGNGELSYSFSTVSEDGSVDTDSGLPSGLVFNSDNSMIEGTVLTPGIYSITITVTDDDNVESVSDEQILSLTLEVMAAIELTQSLASSYDWTAYMSSSYSLPEAAGGAGTLSYSLLEGETLSEQLPTGLSFDNSTRSLSGTTTQTGSFQLTYQVSDNASNSESFNVSIEVAALPAPVFSSNFADQELRINEQISWPALPKANQDPQYSISYSISSTPELPDSVSFDAASRELSGSFEALAVYTVTYTASNLANVSVSQSFEITVLDQGVDKALTEDILAHHALAIADSTARQVKSRMALAGKSRLALEEGKARNGRQSLKSANIDANGLVYSVYGDLYSTSLDQGNEFNWQADLGVTQVGFDVSSKQWFAGVLSETVSSSIDFNHDGSKGSYDLDVGVTTLYGGYKQSKLSFWGATSSGSGGSLDLTLAGSSSTESSDLSYSALLGGLNYQLSKDLDVGGDYILDATLKGGGAEGSASRLNAYVDWHFAQLKNDQGKVWLKPKLNGALRVDSGAADQTGIDVSLSTVMKLGSQFYLDAGLRLLVLNLGGDLSETSYWVSAVWQPKAEGFGASLSQRLGDTSFDRDRLLSSRLITQVEASQSEQLKLEGELSYRWLTGSSDWKLFSRGSGNQSAGIFDKDITINSLFSDRLGLEWTAGNGLSVSMEYRVDGKATEATFQEQLQGYLNTDDAKLNLKASIKLP